MAVDTHEQHVLELLDEAARDVQDLWTSALAEGDFDRVTALSDAGQALHRALLALRYERVG